MDILLRIVNFITKNYDLCVQLYHDQILMMK